MSINNLPNGLFTQGAIQVRGNSGVVSTEPDRLPSIIIPYQPHEVIVRRNRRPDQYVGSYTITGTGDPSATVVLIDVDGNRTIEPVQVGDYGRFDIDVELPWTDDPSYRLLMKNENGSLQSDIPTQVLLPIVPTITTNPVTQAIIIQLDDNVIIGENELIEMTVNGGTAYSDWTTYTSDDFDGGVELDDGVYTIGSIRMRRASGNQVSDEFTLPLNLISPYIPIVVQLTSLGSDSYRVNGIGAIGATVSLTAINDIPLSNPINTTVKPHGHFSLEFTAVDLDNYQLNMTGSA